MKISEFEIKIFTFDVERDIKQLAKFHNLIMRFHVNKNKALLLSSLSFSSLFSLSFALHLHVRNPVIRNEIPRIHSSLQTAVCFESSAY
jgi:hypothetical protein